MVARRKVIFFFVGLAILYTLFAWPNATVEEAYSRGFVKCAEWLMGVDRDAVIDGGPPDGVYGTDAIVLLYSEYDQDPQHDVRFLIANRSNGRGLQNEKTSSRHLGYMPAAVFLSLVLATPIHWKRRVFALGVGWALVHVFVAARLAMILLHKFHGEEAYCLFHWERPWSVILNVTYHLTSVVPASIYVVPLIIWITVTFRREDWDSLLSRFQQGER